MKKLFFILFAFALATGTMAQTVQQKAHQVDKKKDEKKLQNAIAVKKDEKQEVGNDLKHLKVGQAIKDRKEVRADRKVVHRRANHLKKEHGAKHPIIKAQKELKVDKMEKEEKH